jgi:cytochrome c553
MSIGDRPQRALAIGSVLFAAAQAAFSAGLTISPAAKSDQGATPACQACHGDRGEGSPAVHAPRIAGQSADYLKKQLDDFASGTRDNPVMAMIARALSNQQRTELAARYAAMSAPYVAQGASSSAAQLARGHQLAYQGDENKRVQACNNCHGPDGSGLPYSAPYLAGQWAENLASAIKAWQQGTRKNDAGQLMSSVARRLDDADISAVTGYYASLESAAR